MFWIHYRRYPSTAATMALPNEGDWKGGGPHTADRGGKTDDVGYIPTCLFVCFWALLVVIKHAVSSHERVLPQPEAEGSEHIYLIPLASGRGSTIIY